MKRGLIGTRTVPFLFAVGAAMSCATTTPAPKAANGACTGCLTDNPIVVDDGPKALPAKEVTVTPYKAPDHFRNARAYVRRDKSWVTMAWGITFVVTQTSPTRIEGGEGVWQLRVNVLPQEGQSVVTAKTDQYGVQVFSATVPRRNPAAYDFHVQLRAPIECSTDTTDTEAHIVIEYIRAGETDRIREAEIALDDLCVRTLSTRVTIDDPEGLVDSNEAPPPPPRGTAKPAKPKGKR